MLHTLIFPLILMLVINLHDFYPDSISKLDSFDILNFELNKYLYVL